MSTVSHVALADSDVSSARGETLSYATVRDYCDSADRYRQLATHQGDLKDVQRPWAVKAILERLPPGARLLEIGSGEPLAAATLADLGYQVTICDPFDGSGNGPTEFEAFKRRFGKVKFIRSLFTPSVAEQFRGSFDMVFSISVLEHVHGEPFAQLFDAIEIALTPDGLSLHAIDHVLEGPGDKAHEAHLLEILQRQERIAGRPDGAGDVWPRLQALLARSASDLETFYLSPQGHNMWRGATPYEQFSFRKCISVESIARNARS